MGGSCNEEHRVNWMEKERGLVGHGEERGGTDTGGKSASRAGSGEAGEAGRAERTPGKDGLSRAGATDHQE